MWNRDSPVSVVSLHWWPWCDWSLWPRPEPSLGPHADNVIIPLHLTQLSCPGFTLAAGLPSGFTTDGVSCWGGGLWRGCNLTSFSPCLTGPVDYPFASRHKGPGFKSPGGYLCGTGILLLAMSCYKSIILHLGVCCPGVESMVGERLWVAGESSKKESWYGTWIARQNIQRIFERNGHDHVGGVADQLDMAQTFKMVKQRRANCLTWLRTAPWTQQETNTN